MHRILALAILAPAFCLAATAPDSSPTAILNSYCVTCHNQRLKTGGLSLENLDSANAPAHAETWEKVIRKLQARLMPPPGMPRPDEATYHLLLSSLESQLDRAAETNPQPGRPILHRLNRTEYTNAIRDLLALDIDAASLLPPDDSAYGFDNISDALGVSPALQEHYLSAALKIGALAVGDPNIAPGSETWRIRQDLSQDHHLDGMPLGTEGGISAQYNFPLDGEYTFQAKLYRTNLNIMRGLETPRQVEFAVDGQRILLASMGGKEEVAAMFQNPTDTGDAVDARFRTRVPVKAGPHTITAAFLANQAAEPFRLEPYIRSSVDNFDWSGHPHLQVLTVAGPFNPTGPGDTPSRRRIFVCRPNKPQVEAPCARQIAATLLRRAYREPASEDDIARVMKFYEAGRTHGGSFDSGIELVLQRILASPKFLFRSEQDPAGITPGAVYAITDLELASRLSFFLWSSIPDDDLLRVAARRNLHNPAVFDREVQRMLSDPRSEALTDNFAGQWLQLRNVPNVQPNSDEFPDFDDNLRRAFRHETELFFGSIVKEDRSIFDLLTADYTFVNERLARHYGIPDGMPEIYGSHFRRITIHDDARRGLLGQGSILALTSHATRTSPVVRGKWILENLLGTPVPPPPPDVPPLKENPEGERPRTLREQMLGHRANAVCASCHKVMDPIGFALENFDAVGSWRTADHGAPIDASGELADGTKIDGVVGLRNAIVARPEVFADTFTEKLLTYALGRGLDHRDMPAVRAIVRNAARDNYRFSAFISGVVHSVPFRMRMAAVSQSQELQIGNVRKESGLDVRH